MGLLSPYVIIGLMIAISTIFIFLNLRRIEKQTAILAEDMSSIRGFLIQQQTLQQCGPRPPIRREEPVQVNSTEVIAKDEDAMTEDLQREIAEYERQIRELNELKGEEPHQEIMSGLANIMSGIPSGWGMTVIHSAEIPMPVPADETKITELPEEPEPESVPVAEVPEDEVSQAPSETHSVSGSGLTQEARLIAEKYTLPQLKDLCKKHGLAMRGNKNEIASRLSNVAEVLESARKNTLVMKLA
jgi:hypothetical protein